MTDDLDQLRTRYDEFLETRGWERYHTPQNVAQAISVEAAELLELFLWHDNLDAAAVAADEQLVEEVRLKLADVLIYSTSLADRLDVDLTDAVDEKLRRNERRFDPERSAEIRRETERWQRDRT